MELDTSSSNLFIVMLVLIIVNLVILVYFSRLITAYFYIKTKNEKLLKMFLLKKDEVKDIDSLVRNNIWHVLACNILIISVIIIFKAVR